MCKNVQLVTHVCQLDATITCIESIEHVAYCSIESQGFTEDQDKEKTKTPRITDEGWNSQKRLSDPVEKKMKEGKRRKKRLLYPHPKLSSGLVPL